MKVSLLGLHSFLGGSMEVGFNVSFFRFQSNEPKISVSLSAHNIQPLLIETVNHVVKYVYQAFSSKGNNFFLLCWILSESSFSVLSFNMKDEIRRNLCH